MKLDYIIVALVLLCFMLALPMASGSLGTFKQNDCVAIKTILNASSVTLSTLSYPNSTIAVSNVLMTKTAQTFNYTFCDTDLLGVYIYDYYDDSLNTYVNDFEITGNGRGEASGGVTVLFIIVFLICLGFSAYMIIYNLGHFVSLDFDIIDVAFNWGIYFVVVALYAMEKFYLGNPDIESYLLWFITIGGFVMILMPMLAFILSITIGSLKTKQFNVGVPAKFRFRRQR